MSREIKGIIKTENANEHWGFLNPEGKVVLDLGCGINNQEFMPTPMWFIMERKAAKVYGVDSNPQSYQWFKQNYNVYNYVSFMDMVDTTEKIEWYINNIKPDVIKMDIEGSEIMLNGLKSSVLDSVKEFAIEYHNFSCLVSCERLFEDNGYNIEYYKFEHLPIEHQGVIYGYKQI